MRITRVYQPGTYGLHDQVKLSDEASHHVARVLRMHPGDEVTLFRGDNREYSGAISAIKKHKVTVRITDVQTVDRESPRAIHLAQGIAKKDHMHFIIQKAVELGVSTITPLLTQHGAVKKQTKQLQKKHAHWQAIAISACEQSGRNTVPTILEPTPFHTYLESCSAEHKLLLDPKALTRWQDLAKKEAGDIALLIGPEGGLSSDEIMAAHKVSFHGLTLGPRVLRTETATLAALSVLQALEGDL